MIRNLLLVALGGALGSVGRYLVSRWMTGTFPWGTLTVNLLGSLLIGLLTGLVAKGSLSPEMKLLLVTGFCGALLLYEIFSRIPFIRWAVLGIKKAKTPQNIKGETENAR